MSVKIRLQRLGRKKKPFYRIVAIDSKKRRDGLEIERLGWYDPVVKDDLSMKLNEERTKSWIEQGAIPSDTVKSLMKKSGLSYKWHLQSLGLSDDDIVKKMDEWERAQEQRAEISKKKKEEKKLQKQKELEQAARDAAAEEAPAEEAVAEEAPAEEAPAEEAVAEEAPAEEAPAEEAVAEEAPAEEAPAEEAVAEEVDDGKATKE